jgi:hypothetical protein
MSRRPSPAMVVALIALFISLGGVSYGVATGSVGSRELKDGAVRSRDIRDNGVRGKDIRNGSVTGADVRESSLRRVPSATSASRADTAAAAGVANAAYSTFRDDELSLPAGDGPHTILTLNVPQAGSYVVLGKLSVLNDDAAEQEYRCHLVAGGDRDSAWSGEGANSGEDDSRAVAMVVVHEFAAPGDVTMSCENPTAAAGAGRASDRRITAIQVRALSNVAASGP